MGSSNSSQMVVYEEDVTEDDRICEDEFHHDVVVGNLAFVRRLIESDSYSVNAIGSLQKERFFQRAVSYGSLDQVWYFLQYLLPGAKQTLNPYAKGTGEYTKRSALHDLGSIDRTLCFLLVVTCVYKDRISGGAAITAGSVSGVEDSTPMFGEPPKEASKASGLEPSVLSYSDSVFNRIALRKGSSIEERFCEGATSSPAACVRDAKGNYETWFEKMKTAAVDYCKQLQLAQGHREAGNLVFALNATMSAAKHIENYISDDEREVILLTSIKLQQLSFYREYLLLPLYRDALRDLQLLNQAGLLGSSTKQLGYVEKIDTLIKRLDIVSYEGRAKDLQSLVGLRKLLSTPGAAIEPGPGRRESEGTAPMVVSAASDSDGRSTPSPSVAGSASASVVCPVQKVVYACTTDTQEQEPLL